MATEKNVPLGAIHIKFPFQSMDDVSMDGVYGPAAEAVIEKLRDHFAPQAPEEADPPASEDTDEDTTPEPTEQEMTMQVLKRLQGK